MVDDPSPPGIVALSTAHPTPDFESIAPAPAPGGYGLSFTPGPQRVRVEVAGVTLADSARTLVLNETRLAPVYYFPREDVRMDLMEPSAHRTNCPFKGNASYWSLALDGRRIDNLLWSYEDPLPEARAIGGYVAFYDNLVEQWYFDDQPGPIAAAKGTAGANPLLDWLLHVAPGAANARELTEQLVQQLLSAAVPVLRFNVIIRTLHPQQNAVALRWRRHSGEIDELRVPYSVMSSPEYLNSPLKPIFEGAGGVRRRLDIAEPRLDFGILEELHAEGASDYVAMPMVFSDGQINVVTLASDRRGGFTTADLGHLHEILPLLGSLYEVHALRERAATLLDTYLGRHAGSRVLDGLIKRGDGEVIDAIIWFCDLRGSTVWAETLPRIEFLELLNQYFDCMAGALLAHGGEVLRFIGDAALGIFPLAGADDDGAYHRALAAAQEACERIAALNESRAGRGQSPVAFGLALHPGAVTYGNIGTPERLEFTVIGDAANTAARIESKCKSLERAVLVSAPFAARFPERFESLGRHALRGVAEPIEIFALRDPP